MKRKDFLKSLIVAPVAIKALSEIPSPITSEVSGNVLPDPNAIRGLGTSSEAIAQEIWTRFKGDSYLQDFVKLDVIDWMDTGMMRTRDGNKFEKQQYSKILNAYRWIENPNGY